MIFLYRGRDPLKSLDWEGIDRIDGQQQPRAWGRPCSWGQAMPRLPGNLEVDGRDGPPRFVSGRSFVTADLCHCRLLFDRPLLTFDTHAFLLVLWDPWTTAAWECWIYRTTVAVTVMVTRFCVLDDPIRRSVCSSSIR